MHTNRFCAILKHMKKLIDSAMKRIECDLLLRGAMVFNAFTGITEEKDIAVISGKIAAVGKGYRGAREIDCSGLYALPGLIDSHIHVESCMLSPEAFASLALLHGTTAIVADPHEIVNVCGVQGAEYISEAFSRVRLGESPVLDVYMQLPSCVPATPFETSGAKIGGKETEQELARPLFYGLGEMMNVPAVLGAEDECLQKLSAAKCEGKIVDGHAPALSGEGLNAYACAGIATDHESLTAEECTQKIAAGLYCQLRNGSSARNIQENCRAVNAYNYRRFLLCSDDRTAADLSKYGLMDDAVKKAVACGVPANQAICMATLNAAECYKLKGKGALAAGDDADIVFVTDLKEFCVKRVIKEGELAVEDGKILFPIKERYLPDCVKSTVRIKEIGEKDFMLSVKSGKARALCVLPRSIVTKEAIVSVAEEDGDVCLTGTDCNKIAVVERHFASGNIGLGLVKGYGLRGGAIGITVAHDSHNLVILGDNNRDMARVAQLLKEAGGGMALVNGTREEVFPLDIAGLMSSASAREVIACTSRMNALAREMGVKECYEPFMTLAFLALPVIPALKVTDKGLFDSEKFAFINTEVKEEKA